MFRMACQAQESAIAAADMLRRRSYPEVVHMACQVQESPTVAADMVCQAQESVTAGDIAVADMAEPVPFLAAGDDIQAEATSGVREPGYILLGPVVPDHVPYQLVG